MKQKNFLKIAFCLFLISNISFGQILNENFNNDSNFTKGENFFNDGFSDYFGILDPTGSSNDFDTTSTDSTPTGVPSFTGNNGNYLVGEDLDGDGTSSTQTLTWQNLNITGYTGLNFSVKLGATSGFDAADQITLSVNIDSGGYTDISSFSVASGSNQFPTDGTTTLGLAMQTITGNINGTGSSMDVRLTITANSGSEEFAVDDLLIIGTASSSPSIGFNGSTSSLTETNAAFNINIPITVSNYDGNQIDVSIATSGSAEPADFVLNTTSLSFTADGSQNVSLTINPDTDDFDDETITLTLTETSSVSGLIISQATHTVTITDDEEPPTIGFDNTTSTEIETDATFTSSNIPITVSNYSGTQIDINVAVTGTAESGDFTFTNPTALSFTSNETQNITLGINDDSGFEDETIILTITETSSVTGLVISQSTHTLTIDDDEIAPQPTVGNIFITEVIDSPNGFNNDYLELFNNSNQEVFLDNSKLVRLSSDGSSSEYVYDFGTDESTTSTDISIPAFGFLIIARGNNRGDFNTANSIILDSSIKFNGGNTQLFFGTGRRWRLYTGGTSDTEDGTLIDDTSAGVGSDKDYRDIFTNTFITGNASDATPGELEYLVYNGGSWVNSEAIDATTGSKNAYVYDDLTISSSVAINEIGISSGVSLIVTGSITSNSATYQRELTNAGQWYLMSSPVIGETYDDSWVTANSIASGSTTATNRGVSTYFNDTNDGTTGHWRYLQSGASGTFNKGVGYGIILSSTGTVSFTGTGV